MQEFVNMFTELSHPTHSDNFPLNISDAFSPLFLFDIFRAPLELKLPSVLTSSEKSVHFLNDDP